MKSPGGSGELEVTGAVTARRFVIRHEPVSFDPYQRRGITRGAPTKSENRLRLQAPRHRSHANHERPRDFAVHGRYEVFKTTTKYDGKVGPRATPLSPSRKTTRLVTPSVPHFGSHQQQRALRKRQIEERSGGGDRQSKPDLLHA